MESRPCPGCGAALPTPVTYCARCGASLPDFHAGDADGTQVATVVHGRPRIRSTQVDSLPGESPRRRSPLRVLPLVAVLVVAVLLGVLVAGPLRGSVLQAVGLASPTATGPTQEAASPVSSPSMVVASDLTAVKVRGAFGQAPMVTVPAPWSVDRTWSQTLSRGTGAEVTGGSTVEVNYLGVGQPDAATPSSSSWTSSPSPESMVPTPRH